jgi:putative DNA primase/helicase
MTKAMSTRKKLSWRLLFVSAGELTLSEHAASAGKRTKGGAEVRMLNIEADAGRGWGMFEDLHGVSSPDKFVAQLREAARQQYGAPLRAYIENLVRDRTGADRMIRAARESIARMIPADAAGEVRRAADRFALIGAAGELATRWGLTGWREGEAVECAERCFGEWLRGRGTVGNSDVEMGIRQVRAFLAAHGASRFQTMGKSSRGRGDHNEDEAYTIRDRAGFRRRNRDTDETEYLIFKDTFRTEICAGRDYQAVAKELDRRKLLLREPPNMMMKPHLPELGKTWVYGVRAAILEGGE